MNNELEKLCNSEIADTLFAVNTSAAIRRILVCRDEVLHVRKLLLDGNISFEEIKEWVAIKLQDLQRGIKFTHEIPFAALSVVLERVPTEEAGKFLDDLANLGIQEMLISQHVAEECKKFRLQEIASNTFSSHNFEVEGFVIGERPFGNFEPYRINTSTLILPPFLEKVA